MPVPLARGWLGALTLGVAFAALIAVGFVDFLTGPEVTLSVFYFVPIAWVTWRVGRSAGWLLSLIGTVTWQAADYLAGLTYRFAATPLWNGAVRLIFFIAAVHILAQLQGQLALTRALALTDALTELPNSRHFDQAAERLIADASRRSAPLSVAYLDLDDFKGINDTYGHAEGDRVLQCVALALQQTVRASDFIARIGGDEFALLMPDTDALNADIMLERLRGEVEDELSRTGHAVTLCIGVTTFVTPPRTVQEMLAAADERMYEVKRRRKGVPE